MADNLRKRWTWQRVVVVLVMVALLLTAFIRMIVTRDVGDPTARWFSQTTLTIGLLYWVTTLIVERRRRS
ncbi:hypothetical protein [Nocardia sp. NBC_00511]|uniref:hypothetical protein n=1 Tax=Nocardia sp. NBC_00511 TaxID=2903591 RepID=UPI0030E3DDCC